jgi:CxxC-x17-CxxC domain-containing protein
MKDFKKAGRFGGGGFKKRSSDRGGSRGNSGERPELFQATCASCGKTCEVPFRPTGERPVYCRDCFNNPDREFSPPKNFDRGNARSERPSYKPEPRERSGGEGEKLDLVIKKLDKLISLLESKD